MFFRVDGKNMRTRGGLEVVRSLRYWWGPADLKGFVMSRASQMCDHRLSWTSPSQQELEEGEEVARHGKNRKFSLK